MSKIGSKNTSIELIVRRFLFKNKFRYRLHYSKIPGKPDIAIIKYRIAIFVNGCYFHGHQDCKLATIPATREEFWRKKIESNVKRDMKNEELLLKLRWKVIKIWECELEPRCKGSSKREKALDTLIYSIYSIINK